jgi:hypothetical protein
MAVDPRLELARRMLAGQGGPSGGGSLSRQQAAADYRAYAASPKKKQQQKAGGWKGVLATAFENPVMKTALMPLLALDKGRSTLVSGLNELRDAVDFNPNTKASWSDFSSQIGRNMGFGEFIAQGGGLGHKWLDRVAGFAGDVLLDPLTYVTLGGSSMAGVAGRTAMSAKIARQGAKNVSSGAVTAAALEDTLRRAGKYGLGKMTREERLMYNLPQAGFRFMGKRVGGEATAQSVGSGLASLRAGITGSRAGQKVFSNKAGYIRNAPEGFEEAITKLATGRGKISATQAASFIAGMNDRAANGRAFTGEWMQIGKQVLGDLDNDSARVLTSAIESGDLSTVQAQAARKLYDDIRDAFKLATGKDLPYRENYVPHIWSRAGQRLLAGEGELADDLRKIIRITVDDVDETGFAKQRKINADTYKIGGKDVTFRTGTIDDINATLRREFPDQITDDVLETDYRKIFNEYIAGVGEGVGNESLFKSLQELGVASDRSSAMRFVVDRKRTKAENKAAAKEAQQALKKTDAAFKTSQADAALSMRESVKAINSILKTRLSTMRRSSAELQKKFDETLRSVAIEAVDFDFLINVKINAQILDIEQSIINAGRAYDDAVQKLQNDIIQVGNDLKTMRKDRLAQRRIIQQQVDEAKERVDELDAYLTAYKDLEKHATYLRNKIDVEKQKDIVDVNKLLTEEAKKAAGKRTVAEQQTLEGLGMGEGVREVGVPVSVGEEVETAMSRKLVADDKAAGSLYRNTMNAAAGLLDDDTLNSLQALQNLVDGLYYSPKRFTRAQLAKAESKAAKAVKDLNKAKDKLALRLERKAQGKGAERLPNGRYVPGTSTTDQAISNLQKDVAHLEFVVKNSYDAVKEISEGIANAQNVPAGLLLEPQPGPRSAQTFVRDPKKPGTTVEQAGRVSARGQRGPTGTPREQGQKQIDAAVRRVQEDAYARILRETGSEVAATDYAELVLRTYKAMEARARAAGIAGDDAFAGVGQAAYIIAAQDSLQSAVKKARISLDYSRRLRLVEAELDSVGTKLKPQQMKALQDSVMAEVLRSERKALESSKKRINDSISLYLKNFDEAARDTVEKTKAYSLAQEEAESTWGRIEVFLESLFTSDESGLVLDFFVDPTNIRGVSRASKEFLETEGVNPGYTLSQGRAAMRKARSKEFNAMAREAAADIANALFYTDTRMKWVSINGVRRQMPVSAVEFLQSGRFKKFLKEIRYKADDYVSPGPAGWRQVGEMSWKELVTEVRMQEFARLNPDVNISSAKAEKVFSLAERAARQQVISLEEEISQLNRTINKLRPKSFKPESQTVQDSIKEFMDAAAVFKQRAAEASGKGSRAIKQRLQDSAKRMEEAAAYLSEYGVPARVPRMRAQEVLEGKSPLSYAPSPVTKKLANLNVRLMKVEQRMQEMLEDGVLAYTVREVPGNASVFDKAKNYIKAIDEELKALTARGKTITGEESETLKAHAKQLRQEKEKLIAALDQSVPLEDYVLTSKAVLADKKEQLKRLTGQTAQEADLAAAQAKLNARLAAMQTPEAVEAASKMGASAGALADVMRAEIDAVVGVAREAYDASVKAVRDADAAVKESQKQIESFIPAVEEILKNKPRIPRNAGDDQIYEIFEWIEDAYAMLDPEGIVNRLSMLPDDIVPEAIADTSKLYGMGIKASELIGYLKQFPNDQDARIALSLIYRAHEDAAKLLTLSAERAPLEQIIKSAQSKEFVTSIKYVLRDGFEELKGSGMYIPQEMDNMFKRVLEIDNRDVAQLLKAINKYTEIWKAVKTTSPRFHIRNAISAVFMNYVDGVSTRNMLNGAKYWNAFEKDPKGWLNSLPAEVRPYAKQALDSVFAAGGGQYGEIVTAATSLSNRGVFRLSRDTGVRVEGAVRMGQALDAVLPVELGGKGLGLDQAIGKIEKFHFNYSKLSQFDRNAKAMIPFWIFMSRNLPLQLEQMWLNPRTYAIYNSLARNLDATQEGDVVPEWIREGEGFKLPFGNNLFAVPDVGYTQARRDMEMIKNPLRLAQNMNPIPKTALEWWAGKQFYQDIPLSSDKYQELKGASSLLQPLLGLTGGIEKQGDRSFGTQRDIYALMNLIPGLAEVERLVAPSTERGAERQGQNIFSFLTGAPVTQVSDRQIDAERLRQEFAKREQERKRNALRKAQRG